MVDRAFAGALAAIGTLTAVTIIQERSSPMALGVLFLGMFIALMIILPDPPSGGGPRSV